MIQQKGRCYIAGTIHIRPVNKNRLNVPVDVALLEGVDRGHISVADWLLHAPILFIYYALIFIYSHIQTDEKSTEKLLKSMNIRYEIADPTMKDIFNTHKWDVIPTFVLYYVVAYTLLYKLFSCTLILSIILICIIIIEFIYVTHKSRDKLLIDRVVELTGEGMNVLVVRGYGHIDWIKKQLT
ncbi:MAG: hypothetical protein ACP5MB_11085, partial [bacterium]